MTALPQQAELLGKLLAERETRMARWHLTPAPEPPKMEGWSVIRHDLNGGEVWAANGYSARCFVGTADLTPTKRRRR